MPIKPVIFYEDYPSVRITNTFIDPNNLSITRKKDVPFAPDASNKERLIRVLHDFNLACEATKLNLQGTERHEKATEVLGGNLNSAWSRLVASKITNNTANNRPAGTGLASNDFPDNVKEFLNRYLPSNAFVLQQEYFQSASKPYGMDCFDCSDRLELLNDLSVYLPGSGGQRIFSTATSIKNGFYRLMLPDWQLKFEATGNQLDNDNYTFSQLVSFMDQQRLMTDVEQQNNRRRRDRENLPYRNSQAMRRMQYSNPYPRTMSSSYNRGFGNRRSTSNYRSRGQSERPTPRATNNARTPNGNNRNNARNVTQSSNRPNTRSQGQGFNRDQYRNQLPSRARRQLFFYDRDRNLRPFNRPSDNFYSQAQDDMYFNGDDNQSMPNDDNDTNQDATNNQDGFFAQDEDASFDPNAEDNFHADDNNNDDFSPYDAYDY
jgi:hypothetical protein